MSSPIDLSAIVVAVVGFVVYNIGWIRGWHARKAHEDAERAKVPAMTMVDERPQQHRPDPVAGVSSTSAAELEPPAKPVTDWPFPIGQRFVYLGRPMVCVDHHPKSGRSIYQMAPTAFGMPSVTPVPEDVISVDYVDGDGSVARLRFQRPEWPALLAESKRTLLD